MNFSWSGWTISKEKVCPTGLRKGQQNDFNCSHKEESKEWQVKKPIHLLICTLQRTAKIISVGCSEAYSQAAEIIWLFSVSCIKVIEQIFFWLWFTPSSWNHFAALRDAARHLDIFTAETLAQRKQLKLFYCPLRCSKGLGHYHCRDFGSPQPVEIKSEQVSSYLSAALSFLSKILDPTTFLGICLFFKVSITCHVFWDLSFFLSFHNLPRF